MAQFVLGVLDGGREGGPAPVVGHDAQRRPFPSGGGAQPGERVRRQWLRIERAAMRPPGEHVAEQPALELVGGGARSPGHPRHQARLARLGQHAGLGEITQGPQGQADVEQRGTATDHHLAAVRVGGGQPTVGIGVQADLRPAVGREPPRLGVVHRRRPDGLRYHVSGYLLGGHRLAHDPSPPRPAGRGQMPRSVSGGTFGRRTLDSGAGPGAVGVQGAAGPG